MRFIVRNTNFERLLARGNTGPFSYTETSIVPGNPECPLPYVKDAQHGAPVSFATIGVTAMDRCAKLAELAQTENTVALGERHILRQEEIISELASHGHNIKLATALLATFRESQAEHVAHRDRLLKELER